MKIKSGVDDDEISIYATKKEVLFTDSDNVTRKRFIMKLDSGPGCLNV